MAPIIFEALSPALGNAGGAEASRTLSQAATRTVLGRQTTITVTATPSSTGTAGSSGGLSGGAIAGIVIGSICGFLLLLWIFRSCTNIGAPPQEREKWYQDAGSSRSSHGHHRHHHHSRPRSSTSHSARRSRDAAFVDVGTTPVIVQGSPSLSRRADLRTPEQAYVYKDSSGRRGRYYDGRH